MVYDGDLFEWNVVEIFRFKRVWQKKRTVEHGWDCGIRPILKRWFWIVKIESLKPRFYKGAFFVSYMKEGIHQDWCIYEFRGNYSKTPSSLSNLHIELTRKKLKIPKLSVWYTKTLSIHLHQEALACDGYMTTNFWENSKITLQTWLWSLDGSKTIMILSGQIWLFIK